MKLFIKTIIVFALSILIRIGYEYFDSYFIAYLGGVLTMATCFIIDIIID